MNKYLIIMAGRRGPEVIPCRTAEEMTSYLMAWFQTHCGDSTATAWRRVRNRWVPMFPWQHKGATV